MLILSVTGGWQWSWRLVCGGGVSDGACSGCDRYVARFRITYWESGTGKI